MIVKLTKSKKRLYFENNLDKILSILTLISIFYTIFFIPFHVGFAYNVYDFPRESIVDILFDCIFFIFVLRRASYFFLFDVDQSDDHTNEHHMWETSQRIGFTDKKLPQESRGRPKESNFSTRRLSGVVKAHHNRPSSLGSGTEKVFQKTDNKFQIIRKNVLSYIFLPRHLTLDLLCIIPFDTIFGDSVEKLSNLPTQKSIFYHLLFRVPRLCRILRYNEIVNAFFLDPEGKPKSFKMITLFILFLTFQHWFACAWSWNTVIPFTGEVGEMDGGSTFWATVFFTQPNTTWGATDTFETSITNPDSPNYVDRWTRYSNVIYFINWNFLSVGLGDMHSQNMSERILNCVIILAGAICLSFIIGNISVYIYESIKQFHQMKMETELLSTWLSHFRVPFHIRRIVMSSLFNIQEYTPVDTKSFFTGLPRSFAASITCRTHAELFENSTILSGLSPELKYELSLLLFCVELAPGDIIAEIDNTVHHMIFVTGGLLEAVIDVNPVNVVEELQDNSEKLVTGGTTLGYYSQHSVPSVAAVMFKTKEECTIRALTHCTIIMITSKKFRDVLSCGLYEADRNTFQILAKNQRIARFAQRELIREQATTITTTAATVKLPSTTPTFGSSTNGNLEANDGSDDSHGDVDGDGQQQRGGSDGGGGDDNNNSYYSYLNDDRVLKSQVPLSRFPPNPAIWANVIMTEKMYQFTTADLQSHGLWFPACRAYIANYYGIAPRFLVGSANVEKAVKMKDDETYHELFIRGIGPPHSPAKSLWDLVVGIAVIYTIIMTPLLLGFQMSTPATDSLEYLITAIFGFDILVNSRCTKPAPKAKPVDTVPWVLFVNYVKGGLFLDFASTMPWDYVLMASFPDKNQSENLRIFRLLRLLRLTRMLKVVKIWNNLFRINKLQKFMSRHRTMFELIAMVLQISYLCHLFGCLFSFFVHFNADSRPWWKSSILTTSGSVLDPTQPDTGSLSVMYLAAYYWAMSTLSTTGIGDVYAFTVESHAFAIFAMTIGVILFAIFAGRIAAVIETVTINSVIRGVISDWYQFARNANSHDPNKQINGIVRQRIAEFHRVRIRQDSHIDPTDIIEKLPYYVKRKLMLAVHGIIGDTLPLAVLKYNRHKLYGHHNVTDIGEEITAANVPAEFAFAVISKLRPRWLMPLEDGFSNGGLGIVCIIVSGSVIVGLQYGERSSRKCSDHGGEAFENLLDARLAVSPRRSSKSIVAPPPSSPLRRSSMSSNNNVEGGMSRLVSMSIMASENVIEESVSEIGAGDLFFPSDLKLEETSEGRDGNDEDRDSSCYGDDDMEYDDDFKIDIEAMKLKSLKTSPYAFATSITKLLILDVEVHDKLIADFNDIIKKSLINPDRIII